MNSSVTRKLGGGVGGGAGAGMMNDDVAGGGCDGGGAPAGDRQCDELGPQELPPRVSDFEHALEIAAIFSQLGREFVGKMPSVC